jgi:hypothetical protein
MNIRNLTIIIITLLATATILNFSACDYGHDPQPDYRPSRLMLSFEHLNNGAPLQYDTMRYVNAAGNPYLVNEIQYFISDVTLHYNDGSSQLLDGWQDIHYVDTDLPETHYYNPPDTLKPGHVDKITFTFGINEAKNQSLKFVNPPERDMFWPEYMGGGYHYLKLNGKWLATDGVVKPFNFHLGIGQIYSGGGSNPDSIVGFIQNYFEVTLPASSFDIEQGKAVQGVIKMNIENWFQHPHTYDHNAWGGDIMQRQAAMQLGCENGKEDVFSFRLNPIDF